MAGMLGLRSNVRVARLCVALIWRPSADHRNHSCISLKKFCTVAVQTCQISTARGSTPIDAATGPRAEKGLIVAKIKSTSPSGLTRLWPRSCRLAGPLRCANCRRRLEYLGRVSGCRTGSHYGFRKQTRNRRVGERRWPHGLAALKGLRKVVPGQPGHLIGVNRTRRRSISSRNLSAYCFTPSPADRYRSPDCASRSTCRRTPS
jgi:hypothetical protein